MKIKTHLTFRFIKLKNKSQGPSYNLFFYIKYIFKIQDPKVVSDFSYIYIEWKVKEISYNTISFLDVKVMIWITIMQSYLRDRLIISMINTLKENLDPNKNFKVKKQFNVRIMESPLTKMLRLIKEKILN